ncbi:acyltransferase-domain-containing protein [Cryomyces antarcticus]|uniref:Phospholipid/glycerol acyltransferase domain-containing protein n=1 Tax=Cryomyces antarcticus TaxID=329879 RepID=A0ABR0LZL3_9PEZI|nr:hypothetical protein LTR60_001525 [Cryomyces antarcticus]KAK5018910.1 hypothetical protein LTR39_000709 [Cryomyces antarcticus]KAK5164436.1 hypothetical protein LTR04_001843 [Oleoguttula sp. CCFEE 6159]KAK5257278.1 hypothetical protein LTR16_001105 [Cryomyces antarcticus]
MATNTIKQRPLSSQTSPDPTSDTGLKLTSPEPHPAGAVKHGALRETLQIVLIGLYFFISAVSVHGAQFIGSPLYFINRDWYYAYMAMTKQSFGILVTSMTYWWSPTLIRISGDASVRGQLRKGADGRFESAFPFRMILIANHQIYTDWLYLWWTAYSNAPQTMHGHVYIILKESLKYIPVIGPAMVFYGFIFMSRKWGNDEPRLRYRLQKLNSRHSRPMSGGSIQSSAGKPSLDPMWLMIFPEGTNLSNNGRKGSAKWAEKSDQPDLRHALLPRSTGLQFCLQELKPSVDWVYDCTIAYEGIATGQFGQDIFTLRSTYFQGRPPKSVNMYWRRFWVGDIPVGDKDAFDKWLLERWREKDELLEQYVQTGRFPADEGSDSLITNGNGAAGKGAAAAGSGYIETEVRPRQPLEFLQIFSPVAATVLLINVIWKLWAIFGHAKMRAAAAS